MKGFIHFSRVNILARLEFELTYYDSAVQRFNYYTTKTPCLVCHTWLVCEIGGKWLSQRCGLHKHLAILYRDNTFWFRGVSYGSDMRIALDLTGCDMVNVKQMDKSKKQVNGALQLILRRVNSEINGLNQIVQSGITATHPRLELRRRKDSGAWWLSISYLHHHQIKRLIFDGCLFIYCCVMYDRKDELIYGALWEGRLRSCWVLVYSDTYLMIS